MDRCKTVYIDKANYDGSQREKVFRSPGQCNLGHPFDLTLYGNKIYWTDWKARGIHSSNKNNGMRCQLISQSSHPHMGIVAFESTRQKPRPGRSQQPQQISFTLHIHNAHLHFFSLFDLNRKHQVSPRSGSQRFQFFLPLLFPSKLATSRTVSLPGAFGSEGSQILLITIFSFSLLTILILTTVRTLSHHDPNLLPVPDHFFFHRYKSLQFNYKWRMQ